MICVSLADAIFLGLSGGSDLKGCAMEWSSGDSGSDYFDCVTDRSSGSSSEETEYQLRPNVVMEEILSGASTRDPNGKAVKNETQRTQTIRKFRRIDTNRKKNRHYRQTRNTC